MTEEHLKPGEYVRVRRDCPLTLPHFASVLIGQVVEQTEDGHVLVAFGERSFPVSPEWLERVAAPPPDDAP